MRARTFRVSSIGDRSVQTRPIEFRFVNALGGGLAIQLLGLTPSFALVYLVFFLLVVAVGGGGPRSPNAERSTPGGAYHPPER